MEENKNMIYLYISGSEKQGILNTFAFSTREKLLEFLKNTEKNINIPYSYFEQYLEKYKNIEKDLFDYLSINEKVRDIKSEKFLELPYDSIDHLYIEINHVKIDDKMYSKCKKE